jgi:hypothetical protein
MKNLLKVLLLVLLFGNLNGQTTNFTVTNNSGTYSLSCLQTSIALTASTSIIPPYHFQWSGPSFSVAAPSVTISQAGSYTVHLVDSLNTVVGTHFLTINSNIQAPSSLVSPNLQTITCGSPNGAPISFATANNISHTFTSPYGGSVVGNGLSINYSPLSPGTYTHYSQDNTNGCLSSSTFTLVSNQGFPSFNVTSPQNFTLGCGNFSVASIGLYNGNTIPAGGAVSYTVVPAAGLNQLPAGVLSSSSIYSVTLPGIYYAIVKDNVNLCMTQIPISILSNTTAPDLSVNVPNQVLNCNTSQIVLQGTSSIINPSFIWTFTGGLGVVAGSTLGVFTNPVIPSSTLINTFTLTLTNTDNTCKSTTIIPIYQNIFPPNALITVSSTTLSCSTPSIVLTNQSTTTIPPTTPFSSNLPVVSLLWSVPSTQLPLNTSSTYTGNVAGVYTLTVKDMNNGCTSVTQKELFGGCITVGLINNKNKDSNVNLFPNPSNGIFNVRLEKANTPTILEIYTSQGTLIKKQTFTTEESILDLSSEEKGIYFIYLIRYENLIEVRKIIKE